MEWVRDHHKESAYNLMYADQVVATLQTVGQRWFLEVAPVKYVETWQRSEAPKPEQALCLANIAVARTFVRLSTFVLEIKCPTPEPDTASTCTSGTCTAGLDHQ